ncbi:uncharacterized protein LOC116179207 [Photinus pyralis]|uniref:uncharacterized protein LOC116179207 n=1 Tax=Photinus pyralis TaxID=7054 RepID=UPI001266FF30|nr:uncharacterized protein LOC116179207 [Photinus pyralis]
MLKEKHLINMGSTGHTLEGFGGVPELTPEQQKILIEIRRRKTELLLEIQLKTRLTTTPILCFLRLNGALVDDSWQPVVLASEQVTDPDLKPITERKKINGDPIGKR